MTKVDFKRMGAFFALTIIAGLSFSHAVFADGLKCTQVARLCKNGKPAIRAVDSCAQHCPEDGYLKKKRRCPEPAAPLCKDGEVAAIVKGKHGCPVAVCKPITSCKVPDCPAPPAGCSYDMKAAPKDANGCATSCGPMVCTGAPPANAPTGASKPATVSGSAQ